MALRQRHVSIHTVTLSQRRPSTSNMMRRKSSGRIMEARKNRRGGSNKTIKTLCLPWSVQAARLRPPLFSCEHTGTRLAITNLMRDRNKWLCMLNERADSDQPYEVGSTVVMSM